MHTTIAGTSLSLEKTIVDQARNPLVEPLRSDHRFIRQTLTASLPQMIADCLAIQIALWTGNFLLSFMDVAIANHFFAFAVLAQVAFLSVNSAIGLYPGVGIHPAKELQLLFRATNVSNLVIALGVLIVSHWYSPYALALFASYPLQLFLLPPARGLAKLVALRMGMCIPFFYYGELERVIQAQTELNRFGWSRMRPVGRIHLPQDEWNESRGVQGSVANKFQESVREFASISELIQAGRAEGVFLLVVAAPFDAETSQVLQDPELPSAFPQVVYVNPTPSPLKIGASVVSWGICDGLKVEDALLMPGRRITKRLFDLAAATAIVFALAPVLLVIAALVRVSSKGPVVYGHSRIGYQGRTFKAWKFRTMVANADEVLKQHLDAHPELRVEWELNQKLKKDPRITKVGRILRKTSLDELPQLFNVLAGHMSLVGPRPIVKSEIAKYGDCFASYLRVVPGITGLWQISGRNNTTYAERLKYDSYYVHNWSPWLDYYILLRTVKTVVKCEGAY